MIDFKQHTETGDIDLSSGIDMTEPTQQHKRDILLASPGDFKQTPLLGVGLIYYVNANDTSTMLRNVSRQMQRDGIKIKRVGYDGNELIIDGKYKDNYENN